MTTIAYCTHDFAAPLAPWARAIVHDDAFVGMTVHQVADPVPTPLPDATDLLSVAQNGRGKPLRGTGS